MKTIIKKNKGGRPPLEEADRKQSIIKIYCQPLEKETILKEAKSSGLSVSDYAKRRLFGQKIIMNYYDLFKDLHEIGTEFSKAGNNINQLAKHANVLNKMGKLDKSVVDMLSLLLDDYIKKKEDVRVVLRKVIRELVK